LENPVADCRLRPEYAVNFGAYARRKAEQGPAERARGFAISRIAQGNGLTGPADVSRGPLPPARKQPLTVFRCNLALSYNICGWSRWFGVLNGDGFSALDFESANPTVVKSIKQRDLLNTWLRLYAREQSMPRVEEYQPARLSDELADLVYYTVDAAKIPPRLTIQSNGTRMSNAYGNTGKGRHLDEYLGVRLAPVVMPVYYECVARGLPVYTVSNIDDIYGRIVAYERLLLPFAEGGSVTHVIASLKTISEDGGFEIRNLMRGNDMLPASKLRAIIDRDLFHRAPGRIPAGDVIEFS
jgi:hypothetical protein